MQSYITAGLDDSKPRQQKSSVTSRRPWTRGDVDALLFMAGDRLPLVTMAETLGRSRTDMVDQLALHGIEVRERWCGSVVYRRAA